MIERKTANAIHNHDWLPELKCAELTYAILKNLSMAYLLSLV
jgi:hypothetical protein